MHGRYSHTKTTLIHTYVHIHTDLCDSTENLIYVVIIHLDNVWQYLDLIIIGNLNQNYHNIVYP